MCLAVPGRVEEVLEDGFVLADFMGVKTRVAVDLLDECTVGDYIIVHAGFAIEKLGTTEALENLALIKQLLGPEKDEA